MHEAVAELVEEVRELGGAKGSSIEKESGEKGGCHQARDKGLTLEAVADEWRASRMKTRLADAANRPPDKRTGAGSWQLAVAMAKWQLAKIVFEPRPN